jgi:hypothetical protein
VAESPAAVNKRNHVKQNCKSKTVVREIDWDWKKHDDLMRSVQEVLSGKPVAPLTGSKPQGVANER